MNYNECIEILRNNNISIATSKSNEICVVIVKEGNIVNKTFRAKGNFLHQDFSGACERALAWVKANTEVKAEDVKTEPKKRMKTIKISSRAIKYITFSARSNNGEFFLKTIDSDSIETKSIMEGLVLPYLYSEAYNETEKEMWEFIRKNTIECVMVYVMPKSKRAKSKDIVYRSSNFNENNNIVFLA